LAVRRQVYEWLVQDLGQLPPKRLNQLTRPQSIFYSQIGNATLKNRQRTSDDEFIVIQYFGSTPGIWPQGATGLYATGNNWVPGGYVNFIIDTTAYFQNPDDLPGVGLSGSAQPFPISTNYSPAFVGSWDLEIPPDTNWDITYFVSNGFVDPVEDFPLTPVRSWVTRIV